MLSPTKTEGGGPEHCVIKGYERRPTILDKSRKSERAQPQRVFNRDQLRSSLDNNEAGASPTASMLRCLS